MSDVLANYVRGSVPLTLDVHEESPSWKWSKEDNGRWFDCTVSLDWLVEVLQCCASPEFNIALISRKFSTVSIYPGTVSHIVSLGRLFIFLMRSEWKYWVKTWKRENVKSLSKEHAFCLGFAPRFRVLTSWPHSTGVIWDLSWPRQFSASLCPQYYFHWNSFGTLSSDIPYHRM